MIIRKAVHSDSKYIAPLLLLAMEDIIYKYMGKEDHDSALELVSYFTAKNDNQYSYKNCFVAESDKEIIGAVNIYNGAKLKKFRAPIIEYVRNNFNPDFDLEDETEGGEYYIDSLGINPKYQGKGIGSQILQFLIEKYVHENKNVLGLLVEEGNPNAKKLYLKLGFKPVGYKILVTKKMEHLQIK